MTQKLLARAVSISSFALLSLALGMLLLHCVTNSEYGFHRDELAVLDDARRLGWGYVGYPPLMPFVAKMALDAFGPSLAGVRFFSALSQSSAILLTGLMARELGGSRTAQLLAGAAVAIAPLSLIQGALFQYLSFDYLWWVFTGYFALRLLNSGEPRWWLAIGAAIGLGMMTRYTMGFLAVGVVAGVVLTKVRRHLLSPWLWGGAALSLLLFLPNLIWQVQHDFVSLDHLWAIHARDVRIGRTEGYLKEQLVVCANLVTLPLWVAGLWFYFLLPEGRRYRLIGWMYLVPFLLFLAMQGRSYYLAPAYPMLFAAGAVVWETWLPSLRVGMVRLVKSVTWSSLAIGGVAFGAVVLPVAPVNSDLWKLSSKLHDNFVEEIGWQELTQTIASIRAALPPEDKLGAGVLAGNYGEAGAINLYGGPMVYPRRSVESTPIGCAATATRRRRH
jgi:4-amino-4-deoxy-L-arabinose transferase-like glycosyltransferase